MMRAGVVVRTDIEEPVIFSKRIVRLLQEHNVKVYLEEDVLKKFMGEFRDVQPLEFVREKLDFLIVIGGDGTLLRTLQNFKNTPPTLLTIRMGRYGFLMEAEPEEAEDYILSFILGKYSLRLRSRIIAEFKGKMLPPVLNEYAIMAEPGKMVKIKVERGKEEIYTVSCDGILVSTTSGSTAYALSAGGPIVDEHLDTIIIVPLNPFHLHVRPVVLPINTTVKVELVGGRYGATVFADGIEVTLLNVGDAINVKFYDKVKFVKRNKKYYARINRRMSIDP